MKAVKFTLLAETDIDSIWEYIAAKNSSAAVRFVKELVDKCGLLAFNSELGKTRYDLLINLRSFPHKNYIIFYFPTDHGVEIY